MLILTIAWWFAVVASLVFFLFAMFALRQCWRAYQMLQKSVKWPKVVGRIVSSEIMHEEDDAGHTYGNKVAYEYSVDGVTYHCNRRGWMGDNLRSSFKGRANRIAATYPVGQAVTVYYDPSDPAQAVLEPHIKHV